MNNFRLSTFNNLAKKNHNYLKPTLTTPFTEQSTPLKDEVCEAVARPEFEFINLRSASQLQLAAEQYLNLPPVYIKTNEGRIINIETGDLVRDTFVVEVIKTDGTISLFSTVTECALFFNISRSVIYAKLTNGSPMESLNISKFNKIRVFNFIELPYKAI
jgi:DNA invertase Pin-like site-specific DNA recombinase